jgi:hypothetical protein
MARSFRKTPIFGATTADSEKHFKVSEHRRERRWVNSRLRIGDDIEPRVFGNPWAGPKDGRRWWDGAGPEHMRK